MNKRILIVDDEEYIAIALKELFISKGYFVKVGFTGKEALKILSSEKFDLILLDIQIPDINGVEILKLTKERYPCIKTVILTGLLEDYKDEIERIGCDAILNKPFSITTLIKVVESTLLERKSEEDKICALIKNPKILGRAKLLFVELNEIMYSAKKDYFKSPKTSKGRYELEAAFNEDELVEKLKDFKPDIVLSNMGMFKLYKIADKVKYAPNPPKDIILYGVWNAKGGDEEQNALFIGDFFDPITAAIVPEKMDKLGRIVREVSITHNLYIEPQSLYKGSKVKKKRLLSKSLCFSCIFNLLFFTLIILILHIYERSLGIIGWNSKWILTFQLITILAIASSARPLEKILLSLTDRLLFQRKDPYNKILLQASKGMVLIQDVQKLLNLIIHIVKKYMRMNSISIFQYDEKEDAFILRYRRGKNEGLVGYRIETDHALVASLKEKREAVLYRKLKEGDVKKKLEFLDGELCVPSFWKDELLGFLVLGEKLSGDTYTKQEQALLSMLSSEVGVAIENARNFHELEKFRVKEKEGYFQTVLALARTVDEKDHYTRGHLDEVTRLGLKVAKEFSRVKDLNISMDELKISFLLHDIGKIGIPDSLLKKKKELTREEFSIMKQHSVIGARIIEPINKLRNVGRIIRHHQEKYDGSGYPDGLRGEEIPIVSRIIAVVDAYHAMRSDRPYRKALPEEAALKELKDNMGTQFDPFVVDTFIKLVEKKAI